MTAEIIGNSCIDGNAAGILIPPNGRPAKQSSPSCSPVPRQIGPGSRSQTVSNLRAPHITHQYPTAEASTSYHPCTSSCSRNRSRSSLGRSYRMSRTSAPRGDRPCAKDRGMNDFRSFAGKSWHSEKRTKGQLAPDHKRHAF